MGALPWQDSKTAIRAMKMDMLRRIIGSIQFLIDNPDKQTRRALAKNEQGQAVAPTDPTACQWCALGRIAHDFQITPSFEEYEGMGGFSLQGVYIDVERHILLPLGLGNGTFVNANDVVNDPSGRQHELKFLMATLTDRLKAMEGQPA